MNERIKELEAQCWEPRQYGPAWFNSTKFAELIVRECDRYVAEQYDELEPWMQPGDLLKHFGVEE